MRTAEDLFIGELVTGIPSVESQLGRKMPDDFGETLQAATYQTFREGPLQVHGLLAGDAG